VEIAVAKTGAFDLDDNLPGARRWSGDIVDRERLSVGV
jgi:hypothetical protein